MGGRRRPVQGPTGSLEERLEQLRNPEGLSAYLFDDAEIPGEEGPDPSGHAGGKRLAAGVLVTSMGVGALAPAAAAEGPSASPPGIEAPAVEEASATSTEIDQPRGSQLGVDQAAGSERSRRPAVPADSPFQLSPTRSERLSTSAVPPATPSFLSSTAAVESRTAPNAAEPVSFLGGGTAAVSEPLDRPPARTSSRLGESRVVTAPMERTTSTSEAAAPAPAAPEAPAASPEAPFFTKTGREIKAELEARYGGESGRLADSDLVTLPGWEGQRLYRDAAESFLMLNHAFGQHFGRRLEFSSVAGAYRTFDKQVQMKLDESAPGMAAKPGTSNHGWGLAVDFSRELHMNSFDSAEYAWMMENAPDYGWENPPNLRDGKGAEEPWHWTFVDRPAPYLLQPAPAPPAQPAPPPSSRMRPAIPAGSPFGRTAAGTRALPKDSLFATPPAPVVLGGGEVAAEPLNKATEFARPAPTEPEPKPKVPAPTSSTTVPPAAPEAAPPPPRGEGITPDVVAAMFPPTTPRENVDAYLPFVLAALEEQGMADNQMTLYALATIRVETSGFAPISEYASGEAYNPGRHPDAGRMENTNPGDGPRYKGRGFVQLTWKRNYRIYGERLGIDLVGNPDAALDPQVAARVLGLFLKDREAAIRDALNRDDFAAARRLVNGGTHGLESFTAAYHIGESLVPEGG